METIDEKAKEYAISTIDTATDASVSELREYAECDFKAGVEFAQRWIPVSEELPLTFESGNWDGLRSDFVITKDCFDEWHKARIYSGFLDGNNFNDWCSESDYMLSNIVSWRPITLK